MEDFLKIFIFGPFFAFLEFLAIRGPKIGEKSTPKARKMILATQIDKKSLPGAPFGAKDRFWSILGPKMGPKINQNWVPKPPHRHKTAQEDPKTTPRRFQDA